MTPHFGIDIGNSRVKIYSLPAAFLQGGPLPPLDAVLALKPQTWNETTSDDLPQSARVDIVSVRPQLGAEVLSLLQNRHCEPRLWTAADLPIKNPYKDPARLGPDRLLAALAAREFLSAPVIVVDAGTALTVDLVDANGVFRGGAIAPGFGLLARSLGEGGAMLESIDAAHDDYPGESTKTALQLGVTAAFAGALRTLTTWAKEREPQAPVVVTGGDAALCRRLLGDERMLEAPLMLIGLILLARLRNS